MTGLWSGSGPPTDGAWDESVDYPYDHPESVPQTQPGEDAGGTGDTGEDGGGGGAPPPTTGAEITYYLYSVDGVPPARLRRW